MLDWLKNHWFRVLTFSLFLGCCALLVWAITLKIPVFIVTMVAMCAIIGSMSWTDWKRISK